MAAGYLARLFRRPLVSTKLMSEYLDLSTIHGIYYIGQANRPYVERLLWIVVVAVSVCISSGFVIDSYHRWKANPIQVQLSDRTTAVNEIPIPAMTICPFLKYRKDVTNVAEAIRFLREANTTSNSTKYLRQIYNTLPFVCHVSVNPTVAGELADFVEFDMMQVLKNAGPRFGEMFESCVIKDSAQSNCATTYQEVFTEDGICYTFNGLMPNHLYRNTTIFSTQTVDSYRGRMKLNWTLENGYEPGDWYPFRTRGGIYGESVRTMLYVSDEDSSNYCSWDTGFKLTLHAPNDSPLAKQNTMKLSMRRDVGIAIEPILMATNRELETFSPEDRGCYYPHERYLQFFRIYTEDNCFLECMTNLTLRLCGCVAFYMPRLAEMRVCGFGKMPCMSLAKQMMKFPETLYRRSRAAQCSCRPSCTSIEYNADLYQSKANGAKAYVENIRTKQFMRLTMFFKRATFTKQERYRRISNADFVASAGGILSFYLGISLLSITELVYFFTIRPLCDVLMKRRRRTTNGVRRKSRKLRRPPHNGKKVNVFLVKTPHTGADGTGY